MHTSHQTHVFHFDKIAKRFENINEKNVEKIIARYPD